MIEMNKTAIVLIVMLFLGWGLQSILSILQLKKVFRRINELRGFGRVGIGTSGNIYKRKVYGFLVVDQYDTIINAEVLSGWTVFAKLKPFDTLKGIGLQDFIENFKADKGTSKKILDAFKSAADYLVNKNKELSVNMEEEEVA